MNRRKTVITIIAAFAALTGIACDQEDPRQPGSYSDEGGGKNVTPTAKPKGSPKPNECAVKPRPADPPHQKDEAILWFETCVEDAYAPYTVLLEIRGGNGAYPHEIPVVNGTWQHPIVYRKGLKMHVDMELKPSRPFSPTGYCRITDGRLFAHESIDGAWKARCQLTTSQ